MHFVMAALADIISLLPPLLPTKNENQQREDAGAGFPSMKAGSPARNGLSELHIAKRSDMWKW